MLNALGFGDISNSLVMGVAIIAGLAVLFLSWVSDALMRDAGFGLIGNALLVIAGGGATLVGWNRYVGTLAASSAPFVWAVCVGGAMLVLLVAASAKRAR